MTVEDVKLLLDNGYKRPELPAYKKWLWMKPLRDQLYTGIQYVKEGKYWSFSRLWMEMPEAKEIRIDCMSSEWKRMTLPELLEFIATNPR